MHLCNMNPWSLELGGESMWIFYGGPASKSRRNESCRHKWLLLGALNGHFVIFTLQIFCFCRHMWRCGDHLKDVWPTLNQR